MSRVVVGSLGLAVIVGALLALAFPRTGGQGWLAFGALVLPLVTIDEAPWARASVFGGVAGLSFWLTTISWIAGRRDHPGLRTIHARRARGKRQPCGTLTPYTRYGDVFAWGTVVVSAIAVLVSLGARQSKAVRSPLAAERRDAVASRIESATVRLGDLAPVGGRSLGSPLPGNRDDE